LLIKCELSLVDINCDGTLAAFGLHASVELFDVLAFGPEHAHTVIVFDLKFIFSFFFVKI
jgi:hypothetical protein